MTYTPAAVVLGWRNDQTDAFTGIIIKQPRMIPTWAPTVH
jgi:hypothetical protein